MTRFAFRSSRAMGAVEHPADFGPMPSGSERARRSETMTCAALRRGPPRGRPLSVSLVWLIVVAWP